MELPLPKKECLTLDSAQVFSSFPIAFTFSIAMLLILALRTFLYFRRMQTKKCLLQLQLERKQKSSENISDAPQEFLSTIIESAV